LNGSSSTTISLATLGIIELSPFLLRFRPHPQSRFAQHRHDRPLAAPGNALPDRIASTHRAGRGIRPART